MPYIVYIHLHPVHTVAKVSPVIGGHEMMSHSFGILVPRASFRHAVGNEPYNLLLGYNQFVTVQARRHLANLLLLLQPLLESVKARGLRTDSDDTEERTATCVGALPQTSECHVGSVCMYIRCTCARVSVYECVYARPNSPRLLREWAQLVYRYIATAHVQRGRRISAFVGYESCASVRALSEITEGPSQHHHPPVFAWYRNELFFFFFFFLVLS